MKSRIPTVSTLDNLRFTMFHVLPYYLRGIFTRSRGWISVLSFLGLHPFSVPFGNHLKRKYGGEYFYINMGGRKSLLVLDIEGVRRILDNSPALYAETATKRDGMSHFQPRAVTISRGNDWAQRREFNETVLYSAARIHPDAQYFLDKIRIAVRDVQPTCWNDFERMFDRIMLKVVFGDAANATELSRTLRKLMRTGNRPGGRIDAPLLARFRGALRRQIHSPAAHGLVARCAGAVKSGAIQPEGQIPHWMFAIKETVAANTARALALIVAHPDDESLVREEMRRADLSTPAGIDGLTHLEGCVQEAMRLWPTTPLLVRETVKRDTLGGAVIPANTQVLIFNNYNSRDTESYADADRFKPAIWKDNRADDRFNHLSNGRQICAGKNLALFIAKAVLASLLDGRQYRLERPPLNPARLPYTYNYFKLKFTRTTDS